MTKKEIMSRIEDLLEETKCAVLATVSKDNVPSLRWMSPTILASGDEIIYAVSSSDFNKVHDLQNNPNGTWLFQTKDLNEIVNVTGQINVIDNPSIKSFLMEKIGKRLHVFWKLKENNTDFVVLETIIKNAVYFNPLKGEKYFVSFKGGKNVKK